MSILSRRLQFGANAVSLRIIPVAFLNFVCYLSVGLPLAVLPGFVHQNLGFGAVMAGFSISAQYFSTLCCRSITGRMSDEKGPKQTCLAGFLACGASGALLLLAALVWHWPWLSLVVVLCARLVTGFTESCVGTCNITWNIGRVGPAHTADVIAWSGVFSYGAIAVGAPLGVKLAGAYGFVAIGVVVLAVGAVGCLLTVIKPAVAVVGGEKLGFRRVMRLVLPYGTGLALASAGFGTLAAFVTLFFDSRNWSGAAAALSLFGLCFVLIRLTCARQIGRVGGMKVALVSFAVEGLGLVLLGAAPWRSVALIGAALTGAGFSLIYPALGVAAVASVPAGSRGGAISAYSVFFDVALGIAGPLAGLIVSNAGYPTAFLLVGLGAWLGVALVCWLVRRQNSTAEQG